MTIVDKKKQGEKNLKKKERKLPLFFYFFSFFLSRWCEKCNVLVREKYLHTHYKMVRLHNDIVVLN